MLKRVCAMLAVLSLLAACRKEATEAAPRPSLSWTSPSCPAEPPLEPCPDAREKAIEAVRRSLEAGKQVERDYQIEKAYASTEGWGFRCRGLSHVWSDRRQEDLGHRAPIPEA